MLAWKPKVDEIVRNNPLKDLDVLSVLSEVRFGPLAVLVTKTRVNYDRQHGRDARKLLKRIRRETHRAVGLGKYDDLVIGDGLVN